MFAKIANFFIKNSKLTSVLILVTLIVGLGSYIILPKQYNPTIVVPAFEVMIPSPGLEASEISKIIVSPLENVVMELEWIDRVYGIAWDNYGAVMAKFHVGVDKEKAKIRLIQKIRESKELQILWVSPPIITTIDPDELAQIVMSISLKDDSQALSEEEKYIYLRHIAQILKDAFKSLPNVTTLEIVGGYKNNLVVELDLQALKVKNIDIMQVYEALQKNNLSLPAGNISLKNGTRVFLESKGKINSISQAQKLIIANYNGNIIYLEDVANIHYGIAKIDRISSYSDWEYQWANVLLWIGKALGSNAVFVTQDILQELENIKKELPKNIHIEIISNQGAQAQNATNMLLVNLVESVLIVFAVLALYLGVKNAFNTAVSIPLTLWLVFVLALVSGENINKITLFALILVLGMLVDNSTVVVENIARHLNERILTGKTKLQAVLEGTQEVWLGVILSTLTRLLAFGSMFAVTGMMGEYMNPIPKFAIWALLVSLAIAFSINPWISYISAKDITEKNKKDKYEHKEKESPLKLRRKYLKIMSFFIDDTKQSQKRRKIFRYSFWISLFLILIIPISLGIFKARMLPKSNQDQIYIWIDAPREYSAQKTKGIESDLTAYLLDAQNIDSVKNVSSTIGQAYIWDFANLFRWGLSRIWEHQISARVNLFSPKEYKKLRKKSRKSSEEITIELRPNLRKYLLEKYPDIKISLLEDPPGPPVKSTFLIKLQWDASEKNKDIFLRKVEREVHTIQQKQNLVDVYNSQSSSMKKLQLEFDIESVSRAWLTLEQVERSLWLALHGMETNLIKNPESFEATNIILIGKAEQRNTFSLLSTLEFTNQKGEKIPLSSIARLKYSFVSPEIYSDEKSQTSYIYGEMGDNSLIYPVIELFWVFLSDEFLGDEYEVESWNLYRIHYRGLKDGKRYTLAWGGEWELTMDTFWDLGLAMAISLLAIYFVLVGQFASFGIAGIVMTTFLLGFFGVWPGFSFLYLIKNEYFSATSMIGIIALAGIVVGNAIILIDYINVLKKNGLTLKDALLKAGYVRFAPIILTSLTTVFGAATIVGDPVWSGLAWSIIWGLSVSSILTLIVIPIFYYDSQKDVWK